MAGITPSGRGKHIGHDHKVRGKQGGEGETTGDPADLRGAAKSHGSVGYTRQAGLPATGETQVEDGLPKARLAGPGDVEALEAAARLEQPVVTVPFDTPSTPRVGDFARI